MRMRLWNAVYDHFDEWNYDDRWDVEREIWGSIFRQPVRILDSFKLPIYKSNRDEIFEEQFESQQWQRIYDAVERVAKSSEPEVDRFVIICNQIISEEGAPYRFLEDQLMPVMRQAEAAEVTRVLHSTASHPKLAAVNTHLRDAGAKLGGRPPDFRNSIKESISAVEAAAQVIGGKPSATLPDALRAVEAAGVKLHPALRDGMVKLYGWSSDDEGIRHALKADSDETELESLAIYMLVSTSAFIGLLIAKAEKAGRI